MGRRREQHDPDRFLHNRAGNFSYRRRVPETVGPADDRYPLIRLSLNTDDRHHARTKRDILEAADNSLWASLTAGEPAAAARARYQAAVRRAAALGFVYRPLAEILVNENLSTILDRVEAKRDHAFDSQAEAALLGDVERPDDKIKEAVEIYIRDIARDELRRKSEDQKRKWKAKKRQAVQTFIRLNGDLAMNAITRDHAREVHRYWMDKIAPEKGAATHSASTGNRDLGNLRTLYQAYYSHFGDPDRKNPFTGLSFSDTSQRSRPPFTVDWIKSRILAPGALSEMNAEARAIVLAMVDTGARPSELANLDQAVIFVDEKVPYIQIAPRLDPEDPREIKTTSSVRRVPLVGLALAVFKNFPAGFPRYRNKEATLSNTLNKFFDSKGLLPTAKHSVYSLRHSFEDRMKNALLDEELRRRLMGHTIDRPRYGDGGDLTMWRDELSKIVLDFDPSIVPAGEQPPV